VPRYGFGYFLRCFWCKDIVDSYYFFMFEVEIDLIVLGLAVAASLFDTYMGNNF
jgi:hypothetical protein